MQKLLLNSYFDSTQSIKLFLCLSISCTHLSAMEKLLHPTLKMGIEELSYEPPFKGDVLGNTLKFVETYKNDEIRCTQDEQHYCLYAHGSVTVEENKIKETENWETCLFGHIDKIKRSPYFDTHKEMAKQAAQERAHKRLAIKHKRHNIIHYYVPRVAAVVALAAPLLWFLRKWEKSR